MQHYAIDAFDQKILTLVQQSNLITSDQISEHVGLSPSAVQRRLKKMREQGVITADVCIVNPKSVGLALTVIVQVSLEREQLALIDQFKRDMKGHQYVQQCYYVSGSTDFILVVTVKDMEDYENFTHEVFFANENIKHFVTNVVMDPIKTGSSLFIETN